MRLHVGTGYVGLQHVSLEVNKRALLLRIKPDRPVADGYSQKI